MRMLQRLLAAVLAAALALTGAVAAAKGADVSRSQLLGMLVSVYEFISGAEVDESRITSKLSTDKSIRKALELDLITTSEASWVHLSVTRLAAAEYMLAFKNALRTRLYGTATAQATVAQARDELALALRLAGLTDSVRAGYELSAGLDDSPLTRALLCELLVPVYESLYGEIDAEDTEYPLDSTSPYVRKALAAGLMDGYPVSSTFEPDVPVQLRQLAGPMLRLAGHDERALASWSREEARAAVCELMLSCIGLEPAEGESVGCLLDVSWDWYVNQLTTGAYSATNCMPACGEMVLNYLSRENRVTTAMLRALSPHDGEGWYDVELYDVLTGQGVRLDSVYDMSAENMRRDLEDGHLLIVMCNFDGAESGHAMVVCGYETTPAGTWFICNDPESVSTNKYGQPSGYMRRIEAQELVLAMNRHVMRYFRVMGK